MRAVFFAVAAAVALLLAPASFAKDTLYATSLRTQIGDASFIAGNLYAVDPNTAAARLVGAIRLNEQPVGVISVAENPRTGVVYGITAGITRARAIIAIDLERATADIVAPLNVRASDMGFDPDGNLYVWASDQRRLMQVDVATGVATPIGEAIEGASGGAIAISLDGKEALVAVNGATGRLYRVDVRSGFVTPGPELSGAPYEASIDNLTFSPAGELYAVNSDGGAPSKAALVTVDPYIGFISQVGMLPDDVRGLIFAAERPGLVTPDRLRFWALLGLGVTAALLLLYALRARS